MALTGTSILSQVRTATLLDSTSLTDAALLAWVNEGYNRICTRYEWPWLDAVTTLTCTPGVPSVALSTINAGLRRVAAVYDIAQRTRLMPSATQSVLAATGPAMLTDVSSTITEPLATTDGTSMTVASGSLLVSLAGHDASAGNPIYVRFTLDGEIVKITALSTNVATIERGCFGTTAATHLDNAVIKFAPMSEAARPTTYSVWAEALCLQPVPDDDYILLVVYQKAPTAIEAATSPEFDTMFHEALVHYGEFRVWQREEDLDKANAAFAHYTDMVEKMAAWYRARLDHEPWSVGSGAILPSATNTPFLNR